MKRISLILATLMFFAPLVVAQRVSPLVVETLEPTPTVVETAEPILQTYRVRYLDLPDGKKIVIQSNQMKPGVVPMSPFEVMSLKVSREEHLGEEHVIEYAYTLRIINPEKGDYRIPRIKFYWTIVDEKSAANSSGSKVNEFQTEEVKITYVTTLPKEPPYSIRDRIDFGSFRMRAYSLWTLAGILGLVCLVWFTKIVLRLIRSPRKEDRADHEVRGSKNESGPSYKDFRRGLKELRQYAENLAHPDPSKESRQMSRVEVEEKFYKLLRLLILLELPELMPSQTPREMRVSVEKMRNEGRKKLLAELADRLIAYEENLESGTRDLPKDLAFEIRWLSSLRFKLFLRRWYR